MLDNNEIKSVPTYLFGYNIKLKYINLNNNHLANIPRNIFINNTKLVIIQLINNKIKHFIIESKYFLKIKHIYLHGNPLQSLDESTFKPLLVAYHYFNTKLTITFDISSFTCYSLLCNTSWLIDIYDMTSIYTRTYKTIINSILEYKYEGTTGLRSHPTFNSDNKDFYNYLLMRITNCNIQGNCSAS